MISPKDNTQRRMLNNKVAVSPKFARLAARTPLNRSDPKKGETKTTLGSSETLRDPNLNRSDSKQ